QSKTDDQPTTPKTRRQTSHQLAIKNNSVVQNTLLSSQTTTTPANNTASGSGVRRAGQRVNNLHQPTPPRNPGHNQQPQNH
ncbi:hypothetical protein KIH77_08300, partial [Bifidobacterium sp. 82T24]|uniref:hypothetical protein n=1 Tax=Bifidobacterium pluvialisilvae TaxID=2834436 RepID=UPI001C5A1CBD